MKIKIKKNEREKKKIYLYYLCNEKYCKCITNIDW